MHPIKPKLDGKDLSGVKDPNGKHLFMEFVKAVKTGGAGFVDYYWPKPGWARTRPLRCFCRRILNPMSMPVKCIRPC